MSRNLAALTSCNPVQACNGTALLMSVVMRGLEGWTLSKSDENTLAIWGRKIFGPGKEIGVGRIRANQELMDLSREPGIMLKVREGRL
jgi:hypothetical protein